jgi:predicted permease
LSDSASPPKGLGWRTIWRLAGKISFEIQFHSALEMSQGAFGQSIEKQIKKARSNSRMNKGMVSIFTLILAATFGFLVYATLSGFLQISPDLQWTTTALTVSIFTLMNFGFIVFWGVMQVTAFISSGAAAIGMHLPVSRSDAGRLALFGFIRLFDAQIITIVVAFPIAYFLATFSLLGFLLCLGTTLVAMALAITAMLILAIYFHSRIQSSGGSRFSTVLRLVFTLFFVMAIMGFSIAFQMLSFILPVIEAFAIALTPYWTWLAFTFPFSFGLLVSQVTGIAGTPFLWYSVASVLVFVFLGILGVRWSGRFLTQVGTGAVVETGPTTIQPVTVQVSRVGVAVMRKDLRIAFRTPGQAIMFFLPLLMMIPFLFQFFEGTGAIFVTDILILITTPATMLSFFAIFFLSIEARGMAFTLTLPLKTETILRSKAQLITCMAVPIPIIVYIVSLFRPLTSWASLALGVSMIPLVYVAAFLSLVLFTRLIGGGRLIGFEISQHIGPMLGVGVLAAMLALFPLGLYAATWLFLNGLGFTVDLSHLGALVGLWLGVVFNYILGKVLARWLLKD